MTLSIGQVLRYALIAGIAAAILVAIFHFVATEPIIEQAITLETQKHIADGTYEEPLLTRDVQRVGLFVGYLLYGLTYALLFTVVYGLSQRWLPGATPAGRGAWLAALSFWALALVPFLRYPASPPGVGDPDTIEARQQLYLLLLLVDVLGAALAVALDRQLLHRGTDSARRLLLGAGLLLAWAAAVVLIFPGSHDELGPPADLILRFRILSLVGLGLFWLILGVGFGLLARRASTSAGRPRVPSRLQAPS